MLLAVFPAMAGDGFWEDRKRGYFWYEDPPPVEDPGPVEPAMPLPEEKTVMKDNYSYAELFDLHPDQFNKIIDARLKNAVQKPTEENVLVWLEAVDVAKRKSRTMANVAGYVAMQNPRLTGESRYPYAQPGRSAYLKQRSEEISRGLERFRNDYAIIAFSSQGCSYCDAQEEILSHFKHLSQWQVRRLDLRENPHLAAKFNVTVTPTLLLVSRETQESQIISSGVIALDQLNKRVYRLVRLMEGQADPERFYSMEFNSKK